MFLVFFENLIKLIIKVRSKNNHRLLAFYCILFYCILLYSVLNSYYTLLLHKAVCGPGERNPDLISDQLKKKSYCCLQIRISGFMAPDYIAMF
jgi:hypothetical protein